MLVQKGIVDEILTGNCKKVLRDIPSNSVQLTITSPPYRNAIDYNMHVSESGGYYRGKTRIKTSEYLDDMTDIFNDEV